MIEILPLVPDHSEEAAALVSRRYRVLLAHNPHLPGCYSEPASFIPLLQELLATGVPGAAAFQGGQLVGFLAGWLTPDFRGQRAVYSPEWANGAVLSNSAPIYEALYTHLAHTWVSAGYPAHYLSLFPNDGAALHAWHWLGFGMVAVDASRSLQPLAVQPTPVEIRRAEPHDLELVLELQTALTQYMRTSPVFLIAPTRDRSYYEAWLADPGRVAWLAYQQTEPVALLTLGPSDPESCAIIKDDGTTSIYAAYTREHARQSGVGSALLAHALLAARAAGYTRCSVSFEPMNLLGTRFWMRYFQPACYSMVRQVDGRLIESGERGQG